ncbi:MAG: MotA/TolQ/ExbB proton channel family protein [Pirellulaceae bacterium]|nr:MotA/TolQ/ExbB proton channel family protein [Planctomycetales bacterium]
MIRNLDSTRTRCWPASLVLVTVAFGLIGTSRPSAAWQPVIEDPAVSGTEMAVPDVSVDPDAPAAALGPEQLSLLNLVTKGGFLMIPLGLMAVAMVAIVIERLLGLRQARVMPPALIDGLGSQSTSASTFDPRRAYRLCQQFPSACSTVVRAMLLKVGRPHAEVEHTVAEVSQREADRLYANARWLNLIAAVAPLVGLLGTVWGMIRAFFDTTQLHVGQNKANFLAEGIYTALVTTLAGLSVAIPAAIFAHYFEGRIQSLFHRIDELLFNLLPQVERFEGRMRTSEHSLEAGDPTPPPPPPSTSAMSGVAESRR